MPTKIEFTALDESKKQLGSLDPLDCFRWENRHYITFGLGTFVGGDSTQYIRVVNLESRARRQIESTTLIEPIDAVLRLL